MEHSVGGILVPCRCFSLQQPEREMEQLTDAQEHSAKAEKGWDLLPPSSQKGASVLLPVSSHCLQLAHAFIHFKQLQEDPLTSGHEPMRQARNPSSRDSMILARTFQLKIFYDPMIHGWRVPCALRMRPVGLALRMRPGKGTRTRKRKREGEGKWEREEPQSNQLTQKPSPAASPAGQRRCQGCRAADVLLLPQPLHHTGLPAAFQSVLPQGVCPNAVVCHARLPAAVWREATACLPAVSLFYYSMLQVFGCVLLLLLLR